MRQQTLAIAADQSFQSYRKPTTRDEFLKTMDAPHRTGAYAAHPLHLRHWFNLTDLSREEAVHDSDNLRCYVGLIWA